MALQPMINNIPPFLFIIGAFAASLMGIFLVGWAVKVEIDEAMERAIVTKTKKGQGENDG